MSPIENLWFEMKSWIELNYPNLEDLSLPELMAAVTAAWNAIRLEFCKELAYSMPNRLRLVIQNGGERINF